VRCCRGESIPRLWLAPAAALVKTGGRLLEHHIRPRCRQRDKSRVQKHLSELVEIGEVESEFTFCAEERTSDK